MGVAGYLLALSLGLAVALVLAGVGPGLLAFSRSLVRALPVNIAFDQAWGLALSLSFGLAVWCCLASTNSGSRTCDLAFFLVSAGVAHELVFTFALDVALALALAQTCRSQASAARTPTQTLTHDGACRS